MEITRVNGLKGEITVPGDKSISHRSIMMGAIADGDTEVTGFLMGQDCLSTIECFRKMGIEIDVSPDIVTVHGKGLHGLKEPAGILNVGNSGTTMRLISGILSGQPFTTTIDGDESIRKRPMRRIIEPLTRMGVKITSISNNGCAPLQVSGEYRLKGINYVSNVASAQVKSAVLFAGLYADSETTFTEPHLSRNHTEIMLKSFGVNIKTSGSTCTITPGDGLHGHKIYVPGDISSAAYFLVAGLITPDSEIVLKNVGVNPTRTGILTIAKKMGADIELINETNIDGRLSADIVVRSSELKGTTIKGDIIPFLIDELPVISVMAAFAKGKTVIKDARELKVKESDRIKYMVNNLNAMGAEAEGTEDGMIIHGGKPLHGAVIETANDHRIAMSMAVAGLGADGVTRIPDYKCVDISYPGFFNTLELLKH
ncbi:MAG: 3-phosphoshikimate 1-carboxyvinyltransferase [Lachnospiraceae bacterium]|nr:3-phosphoshikimate 1-carboxyvinyltransferase [Lachnospiraceae bacterium]